MSRSIRSHTPRLAAARQTAQPAASRMTRLRRSFLAPLAFARIIWRALGERAGVGKWRQPDTHPLSAAARG